MNVYTPLALWLVLGVPPALAFVRRGRSGLALAVVPFAGGLGMTCPWMVSAATGQPVTGWFAEAALASLLLYGLVELLLGRKTTPPAPARDNQVRRPNRYLTLAAAAIVLTAAGLSIYCGVMLARGFPGYGWDGFMIWLVRAKVLADGDTFPRALATEPMVSASHWEYPLYLPSLLAWFRRLGGLEIRQLAVVIGIIGAVIPLAGWLGLRRLIGAGFAAAVVLAPFAVYRLQRFLFAVYADPLLVMATTTAFAFGMAGVGRSDRASLVAGGIAMAAAVATKNEAALWLAAGSAGLGLFALDTGAGTRKAASAVLRWAAPAAVFFIAWQVARRQVGTSTFLLSRLHFVHMAKKAGIVVSTMAKLSFSRPAFLVIFLTSLSAMVLLAPGGWKMRLRRVAVLSAAPLLYCAVMIVIYCGTPHRLRWHLATSVERVLFGAGPMMLAAAVFAATRRIAAQNAPGATGELKSG